MLNLLKASNDNNTTSHNKHRSVNEEKSMRREDESGANIKRTIPGRNIDTSAPFSAAENPKRRALVSRRERHSPKVFHTEHSEASLQANNGPEHKQ